MHDRHRLGILGCRLYSTKSEMRLLTVTLRRAFILACALVWFGASSARAAEPTVLADLDGDGLHDRVTVDHREPSLLHIWLSKTGGTTTLRSTSPVVGVVARDLDGDRRAELITRDTFARVQVWTRKRGSFRQFHAHRPLVSEVGTPRDHRFDDGATGESDASSWTGASFFALALSAQPRAPDLRAPFRNVDSARTLRSPLPLDPFAPRPPPHAL